VRAWPPAAGCAGEDEELHAAVRNTAAKAAVARTPHLMPVVTCEYARRSCRLARDFRFSICPRMQPHSEKIVKRRGPDLDVEVPG
jgi:hypothetical protein